MPDHSHKHMPAPQTTPRVHSQNDDHTLEPALDLEAPLSLNPGHMSPRGIVQLQRILGNHGLQRLLVQQQAPRALIQRVNIQQVQRQRIRIAKEGGDYVAYYDDQRAGHLEVEQEGGRWWISYVETNAAFQRRGIGLLLVEAAVREHGSLYASNQSQVVHEQHDRDDTRWLTQEGAALVNSCVRNGIMQAAWWANPFELPLGEDNDADDAEPPAADNLVGGLDAAMIEDATRQFNGFARHRLPALPPDATGIAAFYTFWDDRYILRSFSIYRRDNPPALFDFETYPIYAFASEEAVQRALAGHYAVQLDRVRVVENNGD